MPAKISSPSPKVPLFINAYLPVLLWATLIFYLSNQAILPGLYVETYDFIFKKSAHITVYAILYFLVYRSQILVGVTGNKRWQVPFLLVLIYAISDELHQQLVPGRFGTLRDVGYDLLGACLAFLKLYRYI
ncbi:MAG: hypothetical protein GW946_01880 [Candidatus Pacebacteria bacterium]|nr:hypothetical protein [Candidatus Paceibacterota bacterium]PIR60497.1 MAG: hypothetical protein COU67_01855 [Candidatus Pacebacteria bacterium CG10_big_fil_rev_8_21_14_0_10_44_54]